MHSYLCRCLLATACTACFITPVFADDTDGGITHIDIHPLSKPRQSLDESTGSNTYIMNSKAIEALPKGEFASINDILLQAPGVAQDSYGQLHIRGDHGDLQYRINGILLPEGISGFGETLDPHFINKIQLLTGALPAQYGYRTAGIVDITTKSGFGTGGASSVTVGGQNTFGANRELYASKDHADVFISSTYLQNNHGLEPPTSSGTPLHDDTTQDKEFGYLSYAFNPENRFSFIFGNATNRFEIPNNPGQDPAFTLNGTNGFSSSDLNERQFEHNTYAIAALQGNLDEHTDYQLAYFTRYSSVLFKPDPIGDLIFNGIASTDYRSSFTNGIENDFTSRYNAKHTIRAGWTFSYEQAQSDANSLVFPGFYDTATGAPVQTGTTAFSVIQDTSQPAKLFGMYLQDEWRLTDTLTMNYGTRFDIYRAYVTSSQLSPRINFVYDATPATRMHIGYARYFTPPPTELIAPVAIQSFTNTSAAAPNNLSSPVIPEKDNYFDAGITQKLTRNWNAGVDAYYKQAHDLLDEGQFGQALILAPFNYEKGWVRGIEFTTDYTRKEFTTYANLAISKAMGKGIESGQYNFGQDELNYMASNAVHLDHDQLISGSLGGSYDFDSVKYSADMIYGSGMRNGFANTNRLPFYTQADASAEHDFDLGQAGSITGKLSILNLFDRVYEIRDGSGIGVFAPQYGPRRTLFAQLTKPF